MEGGRLRFVDAQLHDGNISLRIGMHEHRPSPVIESPSVVEGDRQRREQLLDATGKLRVTRRGILHPKQFRRKAAEIMNCLRRSADRHAGFRHIPVRGDRKDRFGLRRLYSETPPRFGVAVRQYGIHGVAVSKENCWHQFRHVGPPSPFHRLSWGSPQSRLAVGRDPRLKGLHEALQKLACPVIGKLAVCVK